MENLKMILILVVAVLVVYIIIKLFTKKEETSRYAKDSRKKMIYSPTREEKRRPEPEKLSKKRQERQRELGILVEKLKKLCQNQIWDLSDISANVEEYLSNEDYEYLSKQLPTSIFASTIWDIHDRIDRIQLSNDNIAKIIDSGTENLVASFLGKYSKSDSWIMPGFILDKIIEKNVIWVFNFTNYRKDMIKTIIEKLSVYELLGYRMKEKDTEEEFEDSFLDLQKSTEGNEVKISYYESADTDIISYLEQNYPNESELRQKALSKILADSANIVAMIGQVNNLNEDEVKEIIKRNYDEEIQELFNVFDNEFVANCFEFEQAVKISLELVECNYYEELRDNYDFASTSEDLIFSIIRKFSANELLGYGGEGFGNYDFIKLLEDREIDNEALRKEVFTKMSTSEYFSEGISRWDDVTEDEIKFIMQRNKDEEVNALFGRDDSEDVIVNLPEETAIKIWVGLIYPDALETVKDSYDFGDEAAFKKVINELSADQLLGKNDYDIIELIENEMNDNEDLRNLAFVKICEAIDLSERIPEWDNISEDETKVIMERKNEEEINALFGRDDSEDIVCNLPEEIAIKIRLSLIYPDALETISNSYQFQNENNEFKKVINEVSSEDLLGKNDYDIINLIEDEMGDDEDLRKLAFVKICESPDISEAIARWDNVSEDEAKIITQREKPEEISALLEKEDSNIIDSLPDSFIIKQHLLGDDGIVHDEYFNRMEDDTFRRKVEKSTKDVLPKKLTNSQKDSDVESLSDEVVIKARLDLIDWDECSFDSDDIATEFESRILNDEFRQKVETLVNKFN